MTEMLAAVRAAASLVQALLDAQELVDLARAGDHRVVLHVEAIVARQEVVIKSVGPQVATVIGISGATIMNDGGVASCLDAKTGDLIWTERLPGAYWSSPFAADGLIYCCSQDGHVQVIKAARTFELVAANKLSDGFNASPAVAGKSLILRSKSHLYRIEKRD